MLGQLMLSCQAGAALCPWHGPGLCSGLQDWSQWIAEVTSHDLCASQAGGSPWLKIIPLYLGFLHFALMLPSLFAGCLCPSCCCPAGSAEHWGPLGQWLTPPVLPWSQGLSPGCLSGTVQVAQDMFVFGGSFPGSNPGSGRFQGCDGSCLLRRTSV